jgi:hypothetical protein
MGRVRSQVFMDLPDANIYPYVNILREGRNLKGWQGREVEKEDTREG